MRISVTFADDWVEPPRADGVSGARYDAFVDMISRPLDQLDAAQRPAAHAWRYFGEVNNGGHAQYFMNLESTGQAVQSHVPDVIAGLRTLDMDDVADILAQGYLRWTGAARLAPADLEEASTIFGEREFEDLDDDFYSLDGPKSSNQPGEQLIAHFAANQALYVDVQAPASADQELIAMGHPSTHADGGRAAWLALAAHDSPRIRLNAARGLFNTDRDIAVAVARDLIALRQPGDGNEAACPFSVWSRAWDIVSSAGG